MPVRRTMRMIVMPVLVVIMLVMIMPAAAVRAMGVILRGVMMRLLIMLVIVPVIMDMKHVACRGMVMRVVVTVMVMIAVAMRVMAVIMAAAAGLPMRMMVSVVMMFMPMMGVTMRLGRLVSTTFGLECRLDDGNRGTETPRHLLEHRVTRNADTVGKQFSRHVAIAEMPGQSGEMMGVLRNDFRHGLLRRGDGDNTSVIEHKSIAILQPGGLLKIEEESHIRLPAHGYAATMTTVMRENHAVGRACGIPFASGKNRTGTDHGRSPRSKLRKGGVSLRRRHNPHDAIMPQAPRQA